MNTAPRTGGLSFGDIREIFYTTDDGFPKVIPREEAKHDAEHIAQLYEVFNRFENFHQQVSADRRGRVHLVSVVGGLYGLNLIPIFQPKKLTFFDVNPHAITYFNLIRRLWIECRTADEFLGRLTSADYGVDTQAEEVIRQCLSKKQQGTLTEPEGRSSRSILSSWRYALDHYQLTRELLADVPVHTRIEGMHEQSFMDFVAGEENLWIFSSNIFIFVFFDLTFRFPSNAALFATYFDETDMVDLGTEGAAPVTVHCRIPMSVGQNPPRNQLRCSNFEMLRPE